MSVVLLGCVSNIITSNVKVVAQSSALKANKANLDECSSGPLTLMRLPPEIRSQIYVFVLGPRDIRTNMQAVMSASDFTKRQERVRKHYPIQKVEEFSSTPWCDGLPFWTKSQFLTKSTLNILLVCKHIYIEAFHVFYASNRFYFPDTELLYSFLKGIGYSRRQHLSMVAFDWCGPYAKDAFRLLKTCRRLKSVQFTLPCCEPPGYAAVREIRGLEQARVLERRHYGTWMCGSGRIAATDYNCRCRYYTQGEGPLDDVQELERAMMRPRLKRYAGDPDERLDLFKGKREVWKKTEESVLFEDTRSLYKTSWRSTNSITEPSLWT